MNNLLSSLRLHQKIAPGATLLPGFASDRAASLKAHIDAIAQTAPFRRLKTPGGRPLSAEMTNCGTLGWHSDARGYRYETHDPLTGQPWPDMPEIFRSLAREAASAAGYEAFEPQACLINRYEVGARMGLHQDRDEDALQAPIVSISLGLEARFLFGGLARTDPVQRYALESGDVVVWGGPARLRYHGIAPIAAERHPLTESLRYNLTFRRIRY